MAIRAPDGANKSLWVNCNSMNEYYDGNDEPTMQGKTLLAEARSKIHFI